MWKIVAALVATIMVMQVLATEDEAVDVKKLQQQVSRIEQQLTFQNQELVQQQKQQLTSQNQQLSQRIEYIEDMQQQWLAEEKQLKKEMNKQKDEINKLTQHIEKNNQFQNKVENLLGKVTHDNQNLRHLVDKVMSQRKHNNSLVAFSAFASEHRPYDDGAIVQFDSVITNEGGFYSDQTSTFVCPSTGYYLFSVNMRTSSEYHMYADIEIGGNTVASVWTFWKNDSASNTVIVSCPQGKQVYVRCIRDGQRMDGHASEPISTFTGILLYSA